MLEFKLKHPKQREKKTKLTHVIKNS